MLNRNKSFLVHSTLRGLNLVCLNILIRRLSQLPKSGPENAEWHERWLPLLHPSPHQTRQFFKMGGSCACALVVVLFEGSSRSLRSEFCPERQEEGERNTPQYTHLQRFNQTYERFILYQTSPGCLMRRFYNVRTLSKRGKIAARELCGGLPGVCRVSSSGHSEKCFTSAGNRHQISRFVLLNHL